MLRMLGEGIGRVRPPLLGSAQSVGNAQRIVRSST
jgi:hypothetical protein